MTKYILCLALFALACNPLKRAEKRAEQMERLVSRVVAAKVVQGRDSVIYIPGAVVEKRDSFLTVERDSLREVYKYYYNSSFTYRDTLKFYTRDYVREMALQGDRERYKAESAAKDIIIADKKQALKWALIGLGGLLLVLGALLTFKIKF